MDREPAEPSGTVRTFVIVPEQAGTRVDRFLADAISSLSRSRIRRLIEDRVVWRNGAPTRPGARLHKGDTLRIAVPEPVEDTLRPQDIPLDVRYEDEDVAIINKPPGMVVHPAAGHRDNTLVHALLFRYPQLVQQPAEAGWPGIVHRLDKDTSGLTLVALNDRARKALQNQFRRREIKKTYLSLVVGHLEPPQGRIEAPVARHRQHRKQMTVRSGGREAQTTYRVREYFDNYTWIEAQPETGRTHQIRVHLAAIGHPVAGDPVYGRGQTKLPGLSRQFLHAWRISFRHPSDERWITQTANLATDLLAVLEGIRVSSQ